MIKQAFLQYTIPALILGVGILVSCKNDPKEVKEVTQEDNLPVEEGRNVDIMHSEDGHATFRLKTPLLMRYDGADVYQEFPEGVEVWLYDSAMNVTSHLTAEYGLNKQNEQYMLARKNVVLVNEKNEKLETEELRWDQKTKKITSNAFVKITTQNEILMGDGLEAEEDFSKYKIMKIKGIINLEDAETY